MYIMSSTIEARQTLNNFRTSCFAYFAGQLESSQKGHQAHADVRINQFRTRRSTECSLGDNGDLHGVFSRMMTRRDDSMFGHFQPDNQNLVEFQPEHGRVLTPGSISCNALPDRILPEQPLRERAICPYHHVLNYNPKRVPSSITEVVCSCAGVGRDSREVLCEPMYYNMKVLMFQDDCQKYIETTERIALACVPVFTNQISSLGTVFTARASSAPVET